MSIFKSKRNILFIALGAVVVIVLIILAVQKGEGRKGTKVTAEKVARRTIIEVVSANGKIQPEKDIKISPYISGEVIELYVKEGDQVKKGDLLAKIDPEIYRANFDRMQAMLNSQKAAEANAQARLAQAEAQFRNAELNYNRNKTLWDQKVISDADFDAAKSNYEVAKAEKDAAVQNIKSAQFGVESAKASLDEAEENLVKTSIRSPNDGTVSKLSVEIGERVTGASDRREERWSRGRISPSAVVTWGWWRSSGRARAASAWTRWRRWPPTTGGSSTEVSPSAWPTTPPWSP